MTTDALGMLLGILAVLLTTAMFITREPMLGFPCVIFWAILGGFSYTQSAATWDMHYLLFFGAIGMAIFSALAGYGLREKRDSLGDESMEKGDGDFIGEKPEKKEKNWFEDDGIPDGDGSSPRQRARDRQGRSGTGTRRKGEFD